MTRARTIVALALLGLSALAGHAAEEGAFREGAVGGRAYRLYVPAGAGPEPRPLVVALHGCFQTPEDFALGTQLNAAAERRRVLVLYPAQRPRDDPGRCWNWFEPAHQARTGEGETAQLLGLVAAVRRRVPVDAGRIVVVGFSAGAFMAVNLLCAAPDVVAGVGTVAGGPYRCGRGRAGALDCLRGIGLDGARAAEACLAASGRATVPLRASLWHGARDTVVAPANLGALETMLARVAGAASGVIEQRDGALRALYADDAGRPAVESWLLSNVGHAWSGGDRRGTQTAPWGPDTTERMLDFLLR